MFPLGSMNKEEVRKRAEGFGLRVAKKDESQGLCFIPQGEDYRWFLRKFANTNINGKPGEIVDTQGNVLGNHKGVFSFTVGQRRGLGVAVGKPLYVLKIDPASNRVVVGEEEELYRKKLIVDKINWIEEVPTEPIEVKARIRYRHPGEKALLYPRSGEEAAIEFVTPQRAITPGQAAVFYSGARVLGGGWIREVL